MQPEEFTKTLYTMAYRLTGDIQLAQELGLEAAHAFGRQGFSWSDPGLRAKTARAVADLILNDCRYHRHTASPAGDPSRWLQNALNSLPPQERLAVVLRDCYGLTYPELVPIFRGDERVVARLLSNGRSGVCRWLKERNEDLDSLGKAKKTEQIL